MLKETNSREMRYGFRVVAPQNHGDLFISVSNRRTTDPTLFKVGLAYAIDLKVYRERLIAHGAGVRMR